MPASDIVLNIHMDTLRPLAMKYLNIVCHFSTSKADAPLTSVIIPFFEAKSTDFT